MVSFNFKISNNLRWHFVAFAIVQMQLAIYAFPSGERLIPSECGKPILQQAIIRCRTLNDEERWSIYAYTNRGYRSTNTKLRSKWRRILPSSEVKKLNSSLNKLPDFAGVVFRGVNMPNAALAKYIPEQVITEQAFTSATQIREVALRSAGRGNSDSSSVVFIIESKHGKDIHDYSERPEELEVLFRSGSRFRVNSKARQIHPHFGPYFEISLTEL
jgi:hypothetical protein